jgi:hypothetical protein
MFVSSMLADLLQRLLKVFVEFTAAVDTAAILIREGDRLRVQAALGLNRESEVGFTMKIGEGLVRRHRRYLMQRNHLGLKTGLVFPSEAGTRPVGNDQLNDVWREVQVMAGIDRAG